MKEWIDKIESANSIDEIEAIRVDVIGKKGFLTQEFAKLKDLDGEDKKSVAQNLNILKDNFLESLNRKKSELELSELDRELKKDKIDPSLFRPLQNMASLHPLNQMLDKVIEFFLSKNFSIESGPLVEDDFYNFEALNLPKHHPARDMQDTFYFRDEKLLRTHTSPVQIRTMLKSKPPIKMISPGAVFRRDYDLTHTPMFHQIEGLVVDYEGKVSFANLKAILEEFLVYIFGDVKVRFRSSFFPFTEPSAEVDISCVFCKGDGCRVCKSTGWLEVLGCGLVDENVFKAVGYEKVSGYAFGLGIERFTMLSYGISDLRSFFETDLRLLEQFR